MFLAVEFFFGYDSFSFFFFMLPFLTHKESNKPRYTCMRIAYPPSRNRNREISQKCYIFFMISI